MSEQIGRVGVSDSTVDLSPIAEKTSKEIELAGRMVDVVILAYFSEREFIRSETRPNRGEVGKAWAMLEEAYPDFSDKIRDFSQSTEKTALVRDGGYLAQTDFFQGVKNPITKDMLTSLLISRILDGVTVYDSRRVVTSPLAAQEEARISAVFPDGALRIVGPSQVMSMYLEGKLTPVQPSQPVH